MSGAEPIVLSARGLSKRFGAVIAATQIEIDVPTGQRLSLIGSNGAGKTTFVNMVTGHLRPDTGSISLDGRDITGFAPRAIKRLGVVRSFQIPQLCGELTALDNMMVAAACGDAALSFTRPARTAASRDRAMQMLERFSLGQHAQRPVSELPGGVRKLLDIAMAMTSRPRILMLDEPTSGVSADEKFPMMDTIMHAVGGNDVTVIFVEHDMDIVERYAQRVIAFYSGRVIADGAPAQVLTAEDVRRYVTGGALPA